jgi:DNA-binding transcriptional ArsR family regulator
MSQEGRRKVLEEIMTTEEDLLAKLKELVSLSKPFLKVDKKTAKVAISEEYRFTNAEKVVLLLVGKYFAMNYGIRKDYVVALEELSSELSVKKTTLSAQLQKLTEEGIIEKPERSKYRISLYKVEKALRRLHKKYLQGAK